MWVRVLQGKTSNYDTDVFSPTIEFIAEKSGKKYNAAAKPGDADWNTAVAMRVLADHIRAVSFTIADGQLPSSNKAGYVIRRILRRAVRYSYQTLGFKEPFFNELVPLLADQFKGYMNVLDHKYNPGDENKMWAGTNLAKFNRMLKDFTKDTLTMVGSDFIRPLKNSFYEYISQQLHSGIVLLYVNSKFLYPHKFTLFKLRAPTHFIVLYDIRMSNHLQNVDFSSYSLNISHIRYSIFL